MFDRIREEIAATGPIGFDRYMELALYDESGGYFATGALRSDRGGDFLTSPEVSPLFGQTIASFVAVELQRLEPPRAVIEVGAGSGTLLRPLLDALGRQIDVVVVERSAAARTAVAALVPEAAIVDRVPPFVGVLVANELFDNLPAALVVRRGHAWMERRVGLSDTGFRFLESEPPPEVTAWADRFAGPVPEGGQVEVQLEMTSWVTEQFAVLGTGTMLLIDYGELAENLAHRRAEGTVRTYRDHHLGPDPLAEPGATDITMDVNFSAVIATAQDCGASVEFMRQEEFLERWGLRDQIILLRDQELQAAREGRTMDRLRLRSRIIEADTLLHPRGLGDFRVAILRK